MTTSTPDVPPVTEATPTGLTDFLLERIADDEALIDNDPHTEPLEGIAYCEVGALSEVLMISPARLQIECEVKRRIVELHDGSHECSCYDHTGEVDNCAWCVDSEDCSTLRLLALPYDDHPAYREEWRP